MVKTTNDILDIDPLERMDRLDEINTEKKKTIAAKKKELEEYEKNTKIEIEDIDNKKRREIDDLEKRKQKELDDLDKKRKELHDLESKKIKEIEETQELIEQSFQDLMRHKRIILQEEDDIKSKSKDEELSLEDVANTAPKIIPEGVNTNYSKFFENLEEPKKLYDVTNNAFYSGLTELRNKAASGEITPEEELFIQKLRSQFEQFSNNQTYVEKDQNQYVKRSMQVIDQIGKYQRLKTD